MFEIWWFGVADANGKVNKLNFGPNTSFVFFSHGSVSDFLNQLRKLWCIPQLITMGVLCAFELKGFHWKWVLAVLDDVALLALSTLVIRTRWPKDGQRDLAF